MNRYLLFFLTPFFIATLAISGCGVNSAPISPLGATVGGAKDIGYARGIINSGGIPQHDFIVAEGLYSEHDIPTPVGDCDGKLCLALGYGYAPAVDSSREALFVHLGMTSTIKPDQFKRPTLQLAVVIDKSGSMGGGSIDATKEALRRLVDKLTPEDEIILVEFNTSARRIYGPRRADDRSGLLRVIDGLEADGGTDIEEGLQLGYELLSNLGYREGASKRLMLFTDARPNSGSTDKGSFRDLTSNYAKEGIGLTAFGVGVDFGQDLIYHISQLRGGNFFYLGTHDRIRTVFDKEFDYLVTPIVYNLKLKIATPPGHKLVAVYGLPTWTPGSHDAELNIPTVFLSTNRGAIVLRYESEGGNALAFNSGDHLVDGSLDYIDIDGKPYLKRAELKHSGASLLSSGVRYYSHDGTRLAIALTNVYLGLRLGSALALDGRKQEAIAIIDRAKSEATIDDALLNHSGLEGEIRLLEKLADNIRTR